MPAEAAEPVAVVLFIHGGFWQAGSKDNVAFATRFWNCHGIAFATLGYRLVPDVTLAETVRVAREGFAALVREASALGIDPGRIAAVGHSAGAHLASMLAVGQYGPRPNSLCLLSGVFDLRDLRGTTPSRVLSDADMRDLASGPLGYPPPGIPSLVAYGAEETEGFARQSRWLAEHWRTGEPLALPGREHYSIITELENEGGRSTRSLASSCSPPSSKGVANC
jgi:arylformamidase